MSGCRHLVPDGHFCLRCSRSTLDEAMARSTDVFFTGMAKEIAKDDRGAHGLEFKALIPELMEQFKGLSGPHPLVAIGDGPTTRELESMVDDIRQRLPVNFRVIGLVLAPMRPSRWPAWVGPFAMWLLAKAGYEVIR